MVLGPFLARTKAAMTGHLKLWDSTPVALLLLILYVSRNSLRIIILTSIRRVLDCVQLKGWLESPLHCVGTSSVESDLWC